MDAGIHARIAHASENSVWKARVDEDPHSVSDDPVVLDDPVHVGRGLRIAWLAGPA